MIVLNSCNKKENTDNCSEEAVLADVVPDSNFQNWIPYTMHTALYFRDTCGNEWLWNTEGKLFRELSSQRDEAVVCPEDPDNVRFVNYSIYNESIYFYVEQSLTHYRFRLRVYFDTIQPFSNKKQQVLEWQHRGPAGSFDYNTIMTIPVSHNNLLVHIPDPVFHSEITILGVKLKNVYESKANTGQPVIFYNKEQGILAFRDTHKKYWLLKS